MKVRASVDGLLAAVEIAGLISKTYAGEGAAKWVELSANEAGYLSVGYCHSYAQARIEIEGRGKKTDAPITSKQVAVTSLVNAIEKGSDSGVLIILGDDEVVVRCKDGRKKRETTLKTVSNGCVSTIADNPMAESSSTGWFSFSGKQLHRLVRGLDMCVDALTAHSTVPKMSSLGPIIQINNIGTNECDISATDGLRMVIPLKLKSSSSYGTFIKLVLPARVCSLVTSVATKLFGDDEGASVRCDLYGMALTLGDSYIYIPCTQTKFPDIAGLEARFRSSMQYKSAHVLFRDGDGMAKDFVDALSSICKVCGDNPMRLCAKKDSTSVELSAMLEGSDGATNIIIETSEPCKADVLFVAKPRMLSYGIKAVSDLLAKKMDIGIVVDNNIALVFDVERGIGYVFATNIAAKG